jgi:WD40 repeat protein
LLLILKGLLSGSYRFFDTLLVDSVQFARSKYLPFSYFVNYFTHITLTYFCYRDIFIRAYEYKSYITSLLFQEHPGMSSSDQYFPDVVSAVRSDSRRRLLVGLIGSGAVLLLGSPGLYSVVQSWQRLLTTKPLDLKDMGDSLGDSQAWSNDLAYLACSYNYDDLIRIWDYENKRVTSSIKNDQADISALAWSANNRFLLHIYNLESKYDYAHIACWDMQTQQKLYSVTGEYDLSLGTPSWSPDGKKVAVFYNGVLYLLDARNGQTLYKHEFKDNLIKTLAWAPGSEQVALMTSTSSDEYSVLTWNVATNQQAVIQSPTQQKASLKVPLVWSPKGDYLATVLNGKICLLQTSYSRKDVTFTEALESDENLDENLLAWSSDGQYLAATDYGKLGVWDVTEKRQIRAFYRGQVPSEIKALTWTKDGKQIAFLNDEYSLIHMSW